MAYSKYYASKKQQPSDSPETETEQIIMPPHIEPAISPESTAGLAGTLDKLADVIDRKLANLPAIAPDSGPADILSTDEEWKECDNALERDHIKIDANGRDCDPGKYYKVIHTYPMFQSSNAGENVAWVVVEKWTFVDDGDRGKRRQNMGSFNMKYRNFVKQYKTTLAG